MSQNLQYPLNPDTSCETFTLTNEIDVQLAFGQVYSQAELVPMNYNKIMKACVAGTLTYAPIREFVGISAPYDYSRINDETTFNYQSINLKDVLNQAYLYWKTDLLAVAPFQCPMGIVTQITEEVQQDGTGVGLFHIVTTLKINWLVISTKSLYA